MFTGEDLKQVLLALLRNKLLIILVTAAGLFAGLLYSARQPAAQYVYDATATLSVAYGPNLGQIAGNTVISNYSEIVTSNLVCEHAAELLADVGITGEQIRRMIRVSTGNNSYLFRITARNELPQLAILTANAVAESFVSQVAILTGSNTIRVMDPAMSADVVSLGGSSGFRLLLAPAATFLMICALLVVLEVIMGKARSLKQCVIEEGELLAIVPLVKKR